jgi:hypothetical protein
MLPSASLVETVASGVLSLELPQAIGPAPPIKPSPASLPTLVAPRISEPSQAQGSSGDICFSSRLCWSRFVRSRTMTRGRAPG